MNVTTTPATDLAYTNCAYCSPIDLRNFTCPGIQISPLNADEAAHDAIPNGQLGLNAIQRRYAKVSTGDAISISRFVPTEDFNLALLTLDLEFVKKGTKEEQVDAVSLANRKRFTNQIMTTGQKVTFEYDGNGYIVSVNQATVEGQEKSNVKRGMVSADTYIIFEAANSNGIKKEFNFESLGIGGLSAEFSDIFRRAFASRVFPPHVTSKLGIKHVKGMLLHGPPGTEDAVNEQGCSKLGFDIHLRVQNVGKMRGSHTVLLFTSPPSVHNAPQEKVQV